VTKLIDAFNAMADSLVEKQEQLTQMSSRVIAGQEEELRRLSREIHDDAGQTLTTVLLGLKRLETQATDERVREALPAVRQHVSEASIACAAWPDRSARRCSTTSASRRRSARRSRSSRS